MSRIAPPGHCFEVALTFAAQMWNDGVVAFLVHGTPVNTGEVAGKRYWHAWVEVEHPEHGWLVVDMAGAKPGAIPRDLYYAAGQIEEMHVDRYDNLQAHLQLERYGIYGPWLRLEN